MRRLIRSIFCGAILASAFAAPAFATATATFVSKASDDRCFATVRTPAVYEEQTKRVEVHPAYTLKRQIPAIVEHQRIRVMTKSTEKTYRANAPVYKTIYEQILVEPARKVNVLRPAKYVKWTEEIEVEPAQSIWRQCSTKFGREGAQSAVKYTGAKQNRPASALCRVHIPAKKRIVHHTKLIAPERTELVDVPAKYKTIAKQVVKRPAFAQRASISAEYTSVSVAHELVPARYAEERVPPVFKDVTKPVLVAGNALLRAEVLCDHKTTRAQVAEIQSALVERGYKIRVDGIYGPETQGAMEQFQADLRLAQGYMTLESVRALGLEPATCASKRCQGLRVQTTVNATQAALSASGYIAATDGIHGPQTQAALEQFQRDHGLAVGYLSAETMTALNLLARI